MSADLAQLPSRFARVLAQHGVTTAEQIGALYPQGPLAIHGFGYKALRGVKAAFFPGCKPHIPNENS